MSEGDFFGNAAKRATVASVQNVEACTAAEVVVAVRTRSGRYGVLSYHFGLVFAGVVVAYLLIVPTVYGVGAIAIDGLLAFALAAIISTNFDTLLRALSRGATLSSNMNSAARAAFYDLGISRTSGRTGVLVYVSLFERRCVLLTDIGIDPVRLGAGWSNATGALQRAVERRDLQAFQSALQSLGPVLGAAHPRSEDDVNELPDEVQ